MIYLGRNFFIHREDTYRNIVSNWYPLAKSKASTANFTLIGNKSDMDIRVDREEVEKWCKDKKI